MHLALALVLEHVTEYLYCNHMLETSCVSTRFLATIDTLRISIIKSLVYARKREFQNTAFYRTTGTGVRSYLTPRDCIALMITDMTARGCEM